ncbi:AAA domain containing protein [uncultured Caudovirales phage]|uniref:AAA domain containing protein n=1 Tax=uncultured Caudovirales phage TaxID=2100421 RepID=A0A6J5KRZ5_9CAUD|nr:AAA domain containing protein [uncultured Caudovirales phage]
MFAVIMQSLTPMGVRQTAVVPMMNQAPRVFNRIGAVRGIAGAWKEEAPQFYPNEALAGESKAITITANDYRDLQYPITPTTLLQKLVRTVEIKPMSRTAHDEYELLLKYATENPTILVNYTKAGNNVYIPDVVEPVVEATLSNWTPPVVEEEVVEPTPVAQVEEPVAPLVIQVAQVESEPVMEMAFQSLAPTSGAEAVLVVPDVQPYFPREFEGVSEEAIYDYARKTQQNVLLTGDAGTGKTSSARNYAAKNGLPFVTVECTQQIDQSITQGRFIPTGVGNSVAWKYSQLATAIQRPSVILINELTRMTPKAASLFLRLLQERELLIEPLNEVIKVHPDTIFIADQNTGVGYVGTSKQDNALVDRFNLKLEFHYDSKIESKFIKSAALLEFATSIRQAAEQNDQFSVPMSTRALINFQAQASHLGFVFAANSLLNNFPKSDGEREAIKMRFDADSLTIANELGVDYANYNSK